MNCKLDPVDRLRSILVFELARNFGKVAEGKHLPYSRAERVVSGRQKG